ncbi:MAG: co-chaperone GroES [Firmicutes bacterium]|nr:co-chaperone GroES [Bacillota bacterium]
MPGILDPGSTRGSRVLIDLAHSPTKRREIFVKLVPLGDRVVVKAIEQEEKTKGGIVLPDTAKEKPQEGEVLAVGSGRLLDNGERVPLEVKVGDRVVFAKYGGTEVKLNGETYIILRESDILAISKAD